MLRPWSMESIIHLNLVILYFLISATNASFGKHTNIHERSNIHSYLYERAFNFSILPTYTQLNNREIRESSCLLWCSSSPSSATPEFQHQSSGLLHQKKGPYLAIITETNACDSDEKVDETVRTIRRALGKDNENGIDLISLRVFIDENDDNVMDENRQKFQSRVVNLAKELMVLKKEITAKNKNNDFIVVINDNVDAAIEANVDGVHVKENNVDEIPNIRNRLYQRKRGLRCVADEERNIIIGTSAHSMQTALLSWTKFKPDYFFIGTCYLTKSHPEKNVDALEGPMLPGKVKQLFHSESKISSHEQSLVQLSQKHFPIIFAIGGIDDENCDEPVLNHGADGVAVIRAVMQSSEPRRIVEKIKGMMKKS